MSNPYQGQSADPNVPGIIGENTAGQNSVGVRGVVHELGWGVLGESTTGTGVVGLSKNSHAIYAKSDATGILAESTNGDGVFGHSTGPTSNGRGVVGVSDNHTGVEGNSIKGSGVFGSSTYNPGVEGHSNTGSGVEGHSDKAAGVFGKGQPAGFFDGDVIVQGALSISKGPLRISGFAFGPEQIQALTSLQQQVTNLQQQVTNLQQQLTSLQKLVNDVRLQEIGDVQDIRDKLVQLATRIASLGG